MKKKSGNDSFNKIKETIKSEICNYNSTIEPHLADSYFIYIFDTAFFKYCGVEIGKIPFVIKQMGNDYVLNISFDIFLKIHHTSINLIIKHLENIQSETKPY